MVFGLEYSTGHLIRNRPLKRQADFSQKVRKARRWASTAKSESPFTPLERLPAAFGSPCCLPRSGRIYIFQFFGEHLFSSLYSRTSFFCNSKNKSAAEPSHKIRPFRRGLRILMKEPTPPSPGSRGSPVAAPGGGRVSSGEHGGGGTASGPEVTHPREDRKFRPVSAGEEVQRGWCTW